MILADKANSTPLNVVGEVGDVLVCVEKLATIHSISAASSNITIGHVRNYRAARAF